MDSPDKPNKTKFQFLILAFLVLLVALISCVRMAGPAAAPWSVSKDTTPRTSQGVQPPVNYSPAVTRTPGGPLLPPTPDPPRVLPTLRAKPEEYTIQAGDTLGKVARSYNISLDDLLKANDIANPNLLSVGQVIVIPAPQPSSPGPDFKIIPDSELVYGPASVNFDVKALMSGRDSYLAKYNEDVDGRSMTGPEIVARVSYEYSVNPRLLLAVLEYRSGWVTQANPPEEYHDYPMGVFDQIRKGLYRQLAWTANNLNRGYYLWRVNGLAVYPLSSGELVPPATTINAGTAGVQYLYALFFDRAEWEKAISKDGFLKTYEFLFGNPFNYAIEPLISSNLSQPPIQLPFEKGIIWWFTGGPHAGFGDGSAWAAIDFGPPGDTNCNVENNDWVVAVADGPIIRSQDGEVVQDLDYGGMKADGFEQTGWTVLYLHMESRGRVQAGTYLHAGDHIGHPSCEGGVATSRHLHLARRYNGEWIPADQTLPFVLDGWVSRGTGYEYDGTLEKDGHSIEAWDGRGTNEISR